MVGGEDLALEEFLKFLHFEDDQTLDDRLFAEFLIVSWMVSVDGVAEDELISWGR